MADVVRVLVVARSLHKSRDIVEIIADAVGAISLGGKIREAPGAAEEECG